jgi:hypothetical protein
MGLAKFENSADPIENFQGLEKLKQPLANSRGKGGRPNPQGHRLQCLYL